MNTEESRKITDMVMIMRARERARMGLNTSDMTLFGLDYEPVTEAEGHRVRLQLLAEQHAADKETIDEFNRRKGEARRAYERGLAALDVIFKEGGGSIRRF